MCDYCINAFTCLCLILTMNICVNELLFTDSECIEHEMNT